MSRARCCIAARTDIETLRQAALKAYADVSAGDEPIEKVNDFDGVLDWCQPRTEEVGGEEGSDAWFFWQVGEYAVMADLGLLLQRDEDALGRLSEALENPVLCCAIDTAFGYAYFSAFHEGEMRRRLLLDEDEFEVEGWPVEAERGRPTEDFSEEEADRIWTYYKLPTFELDPEEGPFECLGLRREG